MRDGSPAARSDDPVDARTCGDCRDLKPNPRPRSTTLQTNVDRQSRVKFTQLDGLPFDPAQVNPVAKKKKSGAMLSDARALALSKMARVADPLDPDNNLTSQIGRLTRLSRLHAVRSFLTEHDSRPGNGAF